MSERTSYDNALAWALDKGMTEKAAREYAEVAGGRSSLVPSMHAVELYDRVCTEHDACGTVDYIYDDGRALILFDHPNMTADTWPVESLYPEGGLPLTPPPGPACADAEGGE